MTRIYIASPYKAETQQQIQENVDKVLLCAIALIQKGYSVFIPHLSHYTDLKAKEIGEEVPHEKWIELDLEWLKCCNAMLVLGISLGVKSEIEFAREHSIPVYYSFKDLTDAAKE
jgi:hypothetical protein